MACRGQQRALPLTNAVILALLLCISHELQAQSGAGWLDTACTYRNPVTINNGGGFHGRRV